MAIFVDSSAFYAAADSSDVDHASITQVLEGQAGLVTCVPVLVETWYLIKSRLGWRAADRFWEAIVRQRSASLEEVTTGDLDKVIDIGKAFEDQGFSVVDRMCFALMERLGITTVVSLDDDFLVYRYGSRRAKAFEVLR